MTLEFECSQLVYTSLPGHGFVSLSSEIPAKSDLVSMLRHPIDAEWQTAFDEGFGVTVIEGDRTPLVAVSYLKKYKDEFQRPFVHVHIVFVPKEGYEKLGAHPDIIANKLIRSPDQVTPEQKLGPIVLTSSDNALKAREQDDLDRVGKFTSSVEHLERLLAYILADQRCLVRMPGSQREATEFTFSLLRIMPVRTTRVATFRPRVELTDQYKLLVLSDGSLLPSAGFVLDVGSTTVTPRGPERLLAQAILSRKLEEIRAPQDGLRQCMELDIIVAYYEEARKNGDFKNAEKCLRRLENELKVGAESLKQSGSEEKYAQTYKRLEIELTLDMSQRRGESGPFCEALVKAAKLPWVIEKQQLRARLNGVLAQQGVSREFKMELLLFLVGWNEGGAYITANVAEFITTSTPQELIVEKKIDAGKIVRVLHGKGADGENRDLEHETIVHWLTRFDFEAELHKLISPNTGSSILLQLLDNAPRILNECRECNKLLLDAYIEALFKLWDWPLYKKTPSLKSAVFHSAEELAKALNTSHLLKKLETEQKRSGLKANKVDRLRKRIHNLLKAEHANAFIE